MKKSNTMNNESINTENNFKPEFECKLKIRSYKLQIKRICLNYQ